MELQFVIFVVFVTLTQNSCAQEQSTVYGLSAQASAQLQAIIDRQKATQATVSDGINSILDALELLSIARKYNPRSDSLGYGTLIACTIDKIKTSSDQIFTSIPLLTGGTCPAAETGRLAAYGHLENVFTSGGYAFQLALSRNVTDIQTQFEPISVAMKASLARVMEEYFTTLRTCVQITNSEALAAVKVQETRSTNDFLAIGDACLDAIKIFADGNSAVSSSTNIVASIEGCRRRALSAIKTAVEHAFSPLQGLYISNNLNKPELAANLIADQYAQVSSASSYEKAAALVLDLIKRYLNKLRLGFSEGCNGDDSEIDAAQAEAAANFKDAARAHVESVPIKDEATSAAVQAASEVLNKFADTAAAALFSGIRFGRDQSLTYEQAIWKIQASKAAYVAEFPTFVNTVFSLVQLGSNGSSNAAGLANLQDGALQNTLNYVDRIFNATDVLAQACHGKRAVTAEDFGNLRAIRDGAGSAAGTFTLNVSSGLVSLLKPINDLLNTITGQLQQNGGLLGVLNHGVLNRGVPNRGVLNRGLLNLG